MIPPTTALNPVAWPSKCNGISSLKVVAVLESTWTVCPLIGIHG
jgi:hypothetical protein